MKSGCVCVQVDALDKGVPPQAWPEVVVGPTTLYIMLSGAAVSPTELL